MNKLFISKSKPVVNIDDFLHNNEDELLFSHF